MDGHSGSDRDFTTIESNAEEIIDFIDKQFGGSVLLIGGLSLGGQILLEILSRRRSICQYAMIESARVVLLDCVDQVRKMCGLLYLEGLNIDYFPTNFVLQDAMLYYVDYECNDYMEQWNFEDWGIKYWSKTPEFLEYVKEHPSLSST